MSIVAEMERAIGWPRLWDLALDHGLKCINGLRNLMRVITFPPHALSASPLCEEEGITRDSLLSHVQTLVDDSQTLTHFLHTTQVPEVCVRGVHGCALKHTL